MYNFLILLSFYGQETASIIISQTQDEGNYWADPGIQKDR